VVVIDLDIEINADREQVFTALTGSTALWWGRDFVESKTTSDVILEPRLGGRLYERWGRLGHDSHGAIHATVTAMHRPQLLRLSGPFGLTKKAVQAVLVFELTEESDMKTKLSLSYQAVGNIDEETKGKYLKGWQDLLDRFKTFVEQDGQALRRDPGQGDTGVHFHL
jgi:uncharacterized protein YndB with AHSA1/START domain